MCSGGGDITEIIGSHPYAGLFVLLILGGFGVPFFPEDATFILCGFLIQGNIVKTIPGLIVIYTGALIADFIIYLFGRRYCRMAVCHRWFQKILPSERLAALEEKYQKRGILFVLFGRHFVGLRVQVFLVSGIMRMHPLKFILTDAFTVIFTIALMVSIGYAGGHGLEDVGIYTSKIKHIRYVVVLLFFTFFIGYLVLKYLQSRRKEFNVLQAKGKE
jgi:membrane protein DedA with SNARE-associated domain